MLLIVGSAASGKRSYAETLGYARSQMADGVLDSLPVVYNAQALAAAQMQNASALAEVLAQKEVVICNEVGSGVIPLSRRERLEREAVGRLCILLAARAETVVRMVCGIPQRIKGPAPAVAAAP